MEEEVHSSPPGGNSLAVHIKDLHKVFRTPWKRSGIHAVKGVSIDIPSGSIYGLIGPNGSGKSTTMKALLGLVRPTRGECLIFDSPGDSFEARKKIGFLPENAYFYKFLTGKETLRFYGKLSGMVGKELDARADELLDLVGLQDAGDRRLGGYSKGMLQRIGLAQALVSRPQLLVLDEPTAGVDPIGSRMIRDIIMGLKEQGLTVFLCSHLLEQVEEVCDRVGIIYRGEMVAQGTVSELTEQQDKTEIRLKNASPELLEQIRSLVDRSPEASLAGMATARTSLESLFMEKVSSPESAEK